MKWLLGLFAGVVVAVGLWAFQPWRLFTSSEIDEERPASAAAIDESASPAQPTEPAEPAEPAEPTEPTDPGAPVQSERPTDEVLAEGRFEDAEHDTSGRAEVLRLADGRRSVRLEDLAGSDGPDLHVWLTDQRSGGGWSSYDDGRYVRLGKLKATHGNQNYEIPDDADLEGMRSVVIWCDRFNVAFGTAPTEIRGG
jgi:hypothetical protein